MIIAIVLSLHSCSMLERREPTQIFPTEQIASNDYNTGEVYVSMLKESGNTRIVSFEFKAQSRNFLH